MDLIYLDNSATTRPFDEVIGKMTSCMRDAYFNPSAAYAQALHLEKEVASVRRMLLQCTHATEGTVVFTSGGTEGDNLAIRGTLARVHGACNVVVSPLEHPAVTRTLQDLEGPQCEIRWMKVDGEGRINLAHLESLLDAQTALVICMHVSNETGTIQPLRELSALVRTLAPGARILVDGVQGFLHVPFSLTEDGIDFYTVSAHKVHGPKGTGALVMAKGISPVPQLTGGGQEGGLRSGTVDAPSLLGFGCALARLREIPAHARALREMKLRLWEQLRETPGIRVNGPDPADPEKSAPHILSLRFDGVRGEVMRNALEGEGILSSTGSACSSHRQKVSPVLTAMGLDREAADGTVRISLGALNTPDEMDLAARSILRCYGMLRRYRRR